MAEGPPPPPPPAAAPPGERRRRRPGPAGGRGRSLLDLDDACLLLVAAALAPRPDRWALASTCRRLHAVCGDRRLWRSVEAGAGGSPRGRAACGALQRLQRSRSHGTVAEAVASSDSGDTVVIGEGRHPAQDVRIQHPLRLLGAGPGKTMLVSAESADCGLDCRASVVIADLAILARTIGPCIRQGGGKLRIDRCSLQCDRSVHGLEHLNNLVEVVSPGGRLEVAETQLRGGARAVACRGEGGDRRVQGVRKLFTDPGIFWFSVREPEDPTNAAVAEVQ